MAKKIGVCKNIECSHYNERFEIETGAEMECPFCHKPLKLNDGKAAAKGGKSKLGYIIGATVVVVALGGALAFMTLSDKTEAESAETSEATAVKPEEVVAEPAVATAEPEEVKAAPAAEPVVEEKAVAKEEPAASLVTGRGTVNLGYGTYTGDLKNGKPHGYGVITYTKSQKIVPSKNFVANPGDKFEGDFRDGKISGLGYWTHDGNKTVVKP